VYLFQRAGCLKGCIKVRWWSLHDFFMEIWLEAGNKEVQSDEVECMRCSCFDEIVNAISLDAGRNCDEGRYGQKFWWKRVG
jgi:hypothetical protein